MKIIYSKKKGVCLWNPPLFLKGFSLLDPIFYFLYIFIYIFYFLFFIFYIFFIYIFYFLYIFYIFFIFFIFTYVRFICYCSWGMTGGTPVFISRRWIHGRNVDVLIIGHVRCLLLRCIHSNV